MNMGNIQHPRDVLGGLTGDEAGGINPPEGCRKLPGKTQRCRARTWDRHGRTDGRTDRELV